MSSDMNTQKAPLLSVIVPVFNTGPFITQCVDALLNQEIDAFEVILIDDGSTDGSSELCDRLARKDSRIVVLHKTNEGVSAARNDGLDMARGLYVWFCDSDDWVSPGAFGLLAETITADVPDAICFSFNTIDEDGGIISQVPAPRDSVRPEDGPLQCDNKLYAWSQVIRRDLVCDMRFDTSLALLEDRDFMYAACLSAAGNMVSLASPLYNYRIERKDSAIHSVTADKVAGAYRVEKKIYERELARGCISPAYELMAARALSAMSTIGKVEGCNAECRSIANYLLLNDHTALLPIAARLKTKIAANAPGFFIGMGNAASHAKGCIKRILRRANP